MFFSEDAITKLTESRATLTARKEALIAALLSHSFKNDRAREYATHGFVRRVVMLAYCIENIFDYLPPEEEEIPNQATCLDATAYLQAYLFNLFGALDNLAWIWVAENGVTDRKGRRIPFSRVGLAPNNRVLRATFSKEFRDYLSKYNDWFASLTDFRHALAHRIPFYVPRYVVSEENMPAYKAIQRRKDRARDPSEWQRLDDGQMKLVRFHPWMVHSLSERSPRIVFHPRILSDFAIVDEIGRKMLEELAKPYQPRPRRPAWLSWLLSLFGKD